MPQPASATANTHVELELKLTSDGAIPADRAVERLRALATVGEATEIRQSDRYLDDADRALARAGLSARCRTKAATRRIQVKPVPLLPGSLFERQELSLTLSPDTEPGPAIKDLVESTWPIQVGEASLVQVVLETVRTRYPVDGGTFTAELCIDRVEASAPTTAKRARFEELELELLDGDAEAFSAAAADLRDGLGLSPSVLSKHVRTLRLLGLPGYETSLGGPQFAGETPTHEAARAILLNLLQTIQHHEPGTRAGADFERLHKMRVATRRLRNTLSIFKVAFDAEEQAYLAAEFRWLARVLGNVRDLDVHQLDQRTWRREEGPEPAAGWERLATVLHERWKTARTGLLAALDLPRYATLLERATAAFTEHLDLGDDHPARVPTAQMASQVIKKRGKRFRKAARRAIETADPDDAHDLRVSGKKLRYTMDRFAPILGRALDDQTTRMKAFQDVLGAFQDEMSASLVIAELKAEALAADEPNRDYLSVLERLEASFAARLSSTASVVDEAVTVLGGVDSTKAYAAVAEQALRSD